MNLQTYSTKTTPSLQDVFSLWNTKILPLLPKNLERTAQQNHLFQRKRELSSALNMLRMFFLYAASDLSFRMLSVAASALGICAISDTAWRKKFLASTPFLKQLLHDILETMFPSKPSFSQRNVLLIDGSLIRLQGKKQHQERIHLCYSLNENRIQQVKVTDYHTAETLSLFHFTKQDIVIADAGFATIKNYIFATKQNADVIFRITPKHFPIFDSTGTRIDFLSILKQAAQRNETTMELFAFCQEGKQQHLVRILAQKLPKEKAAQARKRKQRTAQKKQYQLTKETLFFTDYLILVTSLGVEYDREEVFSLYRSRWQVELLFKRFKQHLSITTIRVASEHYAEIMVLLWLLIWVLTEQQVLRMECVLKENRAKREQNLALSNWEKCKYAYFQIKEILCLSWSLFVDFADTTIHRLLAVHNGKRNNQNQEFHTVILPGLIV